MYDEYENKADMPAKEPEAFKVIGEIKNELFRIREGLSPVLINNRERLGKESLPVVDSTPLANELAIVLQIVRDLKKDISL